MDTIIILCWLIFLAYWIITAWSTAQNKEVTVANSKFRWVFIGIILLIILANKFLGSPHFLSQSLFLTPTPIKIFGVIILIIGLLIALYARATLGKYWSSDVSLKENHKLITTGPYKYVRHPIYTGMALMLIGTFIPIDTLLTLILGFLVLAYLIYKLKKEEDLLTKQFPKEYIEYKKQTKVLIPFIW